MPVDFSERSVPGALGAPARQLTAFRATSVFFEDTGAPGVVIEFAEDANASELMRLDFRDPKDALAFMIQLSDSIRHAWPRTAKGER